MKKHSLLFSAFKHAHNRSQRGFSLLELLVVISIIAILIGLISVSFTSVQQKSRDARRRGDLKAAQAAFEQYNAVNNASYPEDGQYGNIPQLPGGLPTDPRGDAYVLNGDEDWYCMCAALESDVGNSLDDGCTYDQTPYEWFCVENQQ